MSETPDTAESVQADAEQPCGCRAEIDKYHEALIEARNYIGTPRSSQSFAGELLEIINRGLAR